MPAPSSDTVIVPAFDPPVPTESPPGAVLSTRLEIEYAVSGGDGQISGVRAMHTWHIDDDRYAATLSVPGLLQDGGPLALQSAGRIVDGGPAFRSATFGQGKIETAVVGADEGQPELLRVGTGTTQQDLQLSVGAVDALGLAHALSAAPPSAPGMRITLIEPQGVRIVQLAIVADDLLSVAARQVRARRYRFETTDGNEALTIWLVPEFDWAPARLHMNTARGFLTFDAVTIRNSRKQTENAGLDAVR